MTRPRPVRDQFTRCHQCVYLRIKGESALCVRNAPTGEWDSDTLGLTAWPQVKLDDWCGEWEELYVQGEDPAGRQGTRYLDWRFGEVDEDEPT